jgi:hypothetical protein
MFCNLINYCIIHYKGRVKGFVYFSSDPSLYVIVDNPRETAIMLNNNMVTMHAWSTKWLVNFNPQKNRNYDDH